MMNIEEIFKKFEKKRKDWDKVVYTPEQVAAGVPQHLIDAVKNHHIETAGQSHKVALFRNVAEDGTETYYLTPDSVTRFLKFVFSPCERPDQDSVEIVSGSAAENYGRFWKD